MSLGVDLDSLLAELDITQEMFEGLASQLVWRIGQRDDDGHISLFKRKLTSASMSSTNP